MKCKGSEAAQTLINKITNNINMEGAYSNFYFLYFVFEE